jgi:putative FmdB family regulatory protein
MPTYGYRCQSCGTRFEVWQKMSDDPLTTCPTCGGPVRRLLYPAGIVFKGSGFYSTDHRSGSTSDTSSASESGSGAGSSSSEKTSSNGAGSSSSEKTSGSAASGESASAAKSE